MISGNRPALHRLFLVLLDNALKYSPAGGDVNISVERKDSLVSVAIEDFGPGIGEADLPHIFKRFYRADQARSDTGHGLGLSLAESIARTHGASIEVRRTESASTVFRVVFTWRDARPALPAFSQPSASPATINAAHGSIKGVQHT
jgi:signal transduction histidine kinase